MRLLALADGPAPAQEKRRGIRVFDREHFPPLGDGRAIDRLFATSDDLIAIVIRFEGAVDGNADVVGLFLIELREFHAQFFQV